MRAAPSPAGAPEIQDDVDKDENIHDNIDGKLRGARRWVHPKRGACRQYHEHVKKEKHMHLVICTHQQCQSAKGAAAYYLPIQGGWRLN